MQQLISEVVPLEGGADPARLFQLLVGYGIGSCSPGTNFLMYQSYSRSVHSVLGTYNPPIVHKTAIRVESALSRYMYWFNTPHSNWRWI